MYKLQVQDNPGYWWDVRAPDGTLLTFSDPRQARTRLDRLFPAWGDMQRRATAQRARVVALPERQGNHEHDARCFLDWT